MIDVLTEICNRIWRTGEWPTPWTQSLIITLPKKGNLQLCQNYRTISLFSHSSKVMLKVIINGLFVFFFLFFFFFFFFCRLPLPFRHHIFFTYHVFYFLFRFYTICLSLDCSDNVDMTDYPPPHPTSAAPETKQSWRRWGSHIPLSPIEQPRLPLLFFFIFFLFIVKTNIYVFAKS